MLLDVPVDFGNVSIGDETCRLSVKVARGDLALGKADKTICGKRLTGSIVVQPKDVDAEQKTLSGMDQSITASFDVKGIRFGPNELAFGLTANLESIDVSELARFAKRQGRLVVETSELLPDESESEDDEEPEPVASNGRHKPSKRQKALLTADAGAALPITSLIEFGMTKSKCAAIQAACGGKNIGDMETLMRSNEWWHRDIKGLGEEWLTKLQDAHLKFRQRYPMPTEDDLKAAEDLAKAREAGTEAASRGIGRDLCSYDAGTPEAAAWLEAWDAGQAADIFEKAKGGK